MNEHDELIGLKKEMEEMKTEKQSEYMWKVFTAGVSVGFALACAFWYYIMIPMI